MQATCSPGRSGAVRPPNASHDVVAGVQAFQTLAVAGPSDGDHSDAADLAIWRPSSLHQERAVNGLKRAIERTWHTLVVVKLLLIGNSDGDSGCS